MTKSKRAWSVLLMVLVATAVAGLGRPSALEPAAPTHWGARFADLILAEWPDPAAIDPARNGWEYNTGIVLFGMSKMYDQSKDPRYLAYIRRWVDSYVGDKGNLGWNQERTHNLDYIQPANLILFLYERTGEERYKIAAKAVREAIDKIPRNADGGFWHKSIYPNEMWIDGIYMAGPFLMRYGTLVGDGEVSQQTAVEQALLAARHCFDPKTGLLFHAWDQDRNAAWANPATGVSPVFWSRGMGWYVMALVDILETLPASHPGYAELHRLLRETVRGLGDVQDARTGLWFQ
ncbi:MAG: glycoside hydrolase family 88 protein, partial [Acidobacteria bacterium]|nr:glycoside hydrolase family 88 protein [Acidobacteriota bacterium]